MSLARAKIAFTTEDYLAWEERNPGKHEYLAGEIFAMVGATDAHVTITGNLFTLLRAHVRGRPCRAYMADMKLRVDAADAFFYPDLLVTCAPEDHASSRFKRQPTLLVEVLSAATAAFDRGQKFGIYRQLPSLREYVLIEQNRMSVECFRRDEQDRWVLQAYGPGDRVELSSLDFSAVIEVLYEDVTLPAIPDDDWRLPEENTD
ncbi:MAG: Uma2 family endonuclease [Candidatus Competibacteraceae bacterium]|jgi:Uma2 family endonuclease|nr:MAG: Uma2 family endonuclease [Candidatus Competibacteraceae bacterium]